MAWLWLESCTQAWRATSKVARQTRLLGVSVPTTIGHLHLLCVNSTIL